MRLLLYASFVTLTLIILSLGVANGYEDQTNSYLSDCLGERWGVIVKYIHPSIKVWAGGVSRNKIVNSSLIAFCTCFAVAGSITDNSSSVEW